MQEWLNWLAWKASIRQKRIGGSNPPHSATIARPFILLFFLFFINNRLNVLRYILHMPKVLYNFVTI